MNKLLSLAILNCKLSLGTTTNYGLRSELYYSQNLLLDPNYLSDYVLDGNMDTHA